MSSAGCGDHEGFLLQRSVVVSGKGERQVKSTRVLCRLRGARLECFEHADEPDLLGRYAHGAKAALSLNLCECTCVAVPTPTVEESIEDMRQRKLHDRPPELELKMFRGPGHELTVRFAAEAGGDVRRWVSRLRAAAWHGEQLGALRRSGEGTCTMRVLLDPALHPEARALVAANRRIARGFVITLDLDARSGADLQRLLSARTGLPPACFALWHDGPGDCSRLPDGLRDRPLRGWLGPLLNAEGRVTLHARLAQFASFPSACTFSVASKAVPPLLENTITRFRVTSQVCR
jgi:hypothetical protein